MSSLQTFGVYPCPDCDKSFVTEAARIGHRSHCDGGDER